MSTRFLRCTPSQSGGRSRAASLGAAGATAGRESACGTTAKGGIVAGAGAGVVAAGAGVTGGAGVRGVTASGGEIVGAAGGREGAGEETAATGAIAAAPGAKGLLPRGISEGCRRSTSSRRRMTSASVAWMGANASSTEERMSSCTTSASIAGERAAAIGIVSTSDSASRSGSGGGVEERAPWFAGPVVSGFEETAEGGFDVGRGGTVGGWEAIIEGRRSQQERDHPKNTPRPRVRRAPLVSAAPHEWSLV